eukprot:gene8428-9117_t
MNFFLLILYCVLFHVYSINVLEVITDGSHLRSFPNVSYGLGDLPDHQRQCVDKRYKGGPATWDPTPTKEGKTKYKMSFTPNRRPQPATYRDALEQRIQTAIVLAVGGHADSHYNYGPGGSINGLMAVWDSWVDNFFRRISNSTSLVLLFDERDFRRQNISTSYKDYLDRILIHNMQAEPVECVSIRELPVVTSIDNYKYHSHHHHHNKGNKRYHHRVGGGGGSGVGGATLGGGSCENKLHLDSGYYVYYINFIDSSSGSTMISKPLIIFATIHTFPIPKWAENKDEEELFRNWKPFRLNRRYPTNYGYTKLTNWYAYYQMNLKLLDYFDYASKLDNDVSFVSPFPTNNLPLLLIQGNHYMMNTQDGWYYDDPRISAGVELCLWHYINGESKYCNDQKGLINTELLPGGYNDSTFFDTNYNTTFRAHFLVYWLGIYTSPEVKHMAKYWNDFHPWGMWDFRWGDQQYWPRPIAMFGNGNLKEEILHYDIINTNNEKYVVHKEWPRWGTIPKTNYYDPYKGTNKTIREILYKKSAKSFIY